MLHCDGAIWSFRGQRTSIKGRIYHLFHVDNIVTLVIIIIIIIIIIIVTIIVIIITIIVIIIIGSIVPFEGRQLWPSIRQRINPLFNVTPLAGAH